LRAKVKTYLNRLEEDYPSTKLNILGSFEKTFKPNKTLIELFKCEKCGEASSLSICKACEMIENINKNLTNKFSKL
jgi:uncharacterized protein (TIGR00269 family)